MQKFILKDAYNFDSDISYVVNGNSLKVEFISTDIRIPGKKTAVVKLNDAARDLINFYMAASSIAPLPVSTGGHGFPTIEQEVEMILTDACNNEMTRLTSPEGAIGDLEIHVLELPEAMMLRHRISKSSAVILHICKGGRISFAHLTYISVDGIMNTGFHRLLDEPSEADLIALVAYMLDNADDVDVAAA